MFGYCFVGMGKVGIDWFMFNSVMSDIWKVLFYSCNLWVIVVGKCYKKNV